jgi:hypothetical protein
MFIPDLRSGFYSPISDLDPGVKKAQKAQKAPDPGSRSATLQYFIILDVQTINTYFLLNKNTDYRLRYGMAAQDYINN